MSMADQALDRGEDCAVAILLCMQSFFCDVNNNEGRDEDDGDWISQQSQDEGGDDGSVSILAREVASAMGGALVARIVQGCLSLLPQEKLNDSSTNEKMKVSPRENATLQLEALKTLRVLMSRVPLVDLWRSMLPGCFAGLYRAALSKLRYSSAASSYKVASACVRVLGLLLKQSLSGYNPPSKSADPTGANANDSSIQSITTSLLAAVQVSKQPADVGNSPASMPLSPREKQMQEVRTEVNQRLVGPLSVLLSLLPANRSSAVRKSGLYLCGIILMDIRSVWMESNMKALGRKSLEYCLMMLGDDNDNISICSSGILHSYKSHLGATVWKRQLSQTIVPTILELVEALPAFAKSGRESEVHNYLRLIDGYLVISFRGMNNDFDAQECLREKRKSDIGSALSCAEPVDVVKKCFSDIDSITCSPMIEADASTDPNKMILFQENNRCRFLYLKDEAIDAAKNTVHLFARALGTKRCVFVIDACFAEMFESCSRSCNDHLLISEGLNRRLHWSGSCAFAAELLRGMCGLGNDKKSPNLSKSNLHILSSLASSVLPVIVSGPLWTLPTSLGMHTGTSSSDTSALANGAQTDGQLKFDRLRSKGMTSAQSATIMNSNAILISVLMGFICQFTNALGDKIRLHLPTILFPLLERASPIGNHSFVQRAAFATLWEISVSVGCKDISSLLAFNFDYLVDIISLRLRKCAREQTPMERSLMGVVDVILRSLVHHGGATSNARDGEMPLASGHVTMVGHMLKCILSHFDRQSYMNNLSVFDTVSVFRSMGTFMDASIEIYISNKADAALKTPETEVHDWFQRLDFELDMGSAGYTDDNDSNEMFGELDNNEGNEPTDEVPQVQDSPDDQGETDFVHEIESIDAATSSVMQISKSNETMLSGFQSLGKIGSFRRKLRGESASNPLLPAIAEFWPTIIARLRSALASLVSVNRLSRSDLSIRHMMATDQEQGPSRASLEVLISKLIMIISEFCISSDGFFVDRFENDMYPILAKLMQDILPRDRKNMGFACPPTSLAQQNHSLVLPILHCFKCTFESSCGDGLAVLIPSAGTMLFPLLSFDGPIGDGAMAAVKAMLAVDCDALWRGLLALSGKSFPCNPITKSDLRSKSVTAVTVSVACSHRMKDYDHTLSQKACELLDFIEGLHEQPV
ncbi:hypothetical protein ACHAXR_009215 [Thalassiosira sp. AJA248-18]